MHVAAGGNPTGACMGSLFSRVAGITNTLNGMPANTLIVPSAVEGKVPENLILFPAASQTLVSYLQFTVLLTLVQEVTF